MMAGSESALNGWADYWCVKKESPQGSPRALGGFLPLGLCSAGGRTAVTAI
jgi:hypothetical protein